MASIDRSTSSSRAREAGDGCYARRTRPGASWSSSPAPDAAPAATVTTTGHAFVQWGTKRRAWQACGVRVDGDAEYAASVLDAINVI